jgi:hypothetical protein
MALEFTPLKHQTPNHNINGIAGWSNRTIYSYYGSPGQNTYFDYYTAAAGIYYRNLFALIKNYVFPNTNSMPIYKGTNKFPARYFSTGKNLRVKGRFFISCGNTSPVFNMRVNIVDPTLGESTIAESNNGANHTLSDNLTNMPLDFEIMLTGIETLQTNTSPVAETYETFIQANGFFQHESVDYNHPGPNTSVSYVPIYATSPYNSSTGEIDGNKEISITFNNSSNVTSIKVIYLTIEEMA